MSKGKNVTSPKEVLQNPEVSNEELKMQNTEEVVDQNVSDEQLKEELDKGVDETLHEQGIESGELHRLHLKIRKKHPQDKFRVGTQVIVNYSFLPYDLSNDEMNELFSAGPSSWLEAKEGTFEALKAKFEANLKK